jgi:uncharacterized protein (DUF2336 family)
MHAWNAYSAAPKRVPQVEHTHAADGARTYRTNMHQWTAPAAERAHTHAADGERTNAMDEAHVQQMEHTHATLGNPDMERTEWARPRLNF